jgi:hypothetical protein
VEVISTSVTTVVVVIVVVVEIISTLVMVAVGRGGDYLDTSSGSGRERWRLSREISCSEADLWATNCPLVLAYSGLGDGGHFQWSLYTFRIQSVFLLLIKYTHDYPHDAVSAQRFLVLYLMKIISVAAVAVSVARELFLRLPELFLWLINLFWWLTKLFIGLSELF